jgi:glucosylceramidase
MGLNYNLGRTNMGGCDFSVRPYSYLDTPGDVSMETFALQEEDTIYKIPYMHLAASMRPESAPIKFYASPWSAPAWMKTNNDFIGIGVLLPGEQFT